MSIIIILFGTGFLGTASLCLAQGDTWATKANMPTASHSHRTCVVNGKIYAIGGDTTGLGCNFHFHSQKVEVYNPATDTWSTKTDMPTARASLSISAVNGKIYAIGGDTIQCSIGLSTVEEYDPQTDSWSTKTNMQVVRSGLSSSVVDGKIYAIGGWSFSNDIVLDDVEEYDPLTDTWIPKASMHDGRAWFSTCVVDGKIYAIGGRSTTSKRKTVEVYDPATDIWTRKNDMPNALGNYFVSTVNGLIYIFGGTFSNGGSPRPYVRVYNPIADSWSSLSNIPTARSAGHASEVNGKIYIIGGSSTSWPFTPTSTVFEYTPPGVTDVEDATLVEHNPEVFALSQNYPNPFNPETTIQYQMAKRSEVNLVIFSLLGQRVATLVDEVQSMGIYSVQWDGKDDTGKEVASGVYLYRLQTNQFMQVKKLALLR
jgi:N-acetylneuraminic acid mutarotase